MRRDARPFDLAEALARIPRVQRPSLPVRLWHWRHLVLLGAVAPAGLVALGAAVHPLAPVSMVAAFVICWVATPDLRVWTVGRLRCIVAPHKVRATFLQGRICAPDGRTPTILWTSPTPSGVRLWIRCPLGMRSAQLVECADLLGVACCADEVVVVTEPTRRTVIIGLAYVPRNSWLGV